MELRTARDYLQLAVKTAYSKWWIIEQGVCNRTIRKPITKEDMTVMLMPPPVPPGPHAMSSSPLERHTMPKHSIGVILWQGVS